MSLEKVPFINYKLDDDKSKKTDVITIWLNEEDRKVLDDCKVRLEQPKDSTCFKTLAMIGAKLLNSEPTGYILGVCFKNRRKNHRSGIIEIEQT